MPLDHQLRYTEADLRAMLAEVTAERDEAAGLLRDAFVRLRHKGLRASILAYLERIEP